MEDNVSWPPRSNDRFCIWKHLLNHIWVTKALNRPQKPPNMMLYHGISWHIASILSERGLRFGAVYYPLYPYILFSRRWIFVASKPAADSPACASQPWASGRLVLTHPPPEPEEGQHGKEKISLQGIDTLMLRMWNIFKWNCLILTVLGSGGSQ